MVDFEIAPFCFPDELLQGLTYTPENVKDYGLLVLRSSNIQNGRLVFDDTIYVDCKVDSNRLVHKGDIIICVRNGSSTLIGKCAIAEYDYNATWGAFMTCVRSDRNEFLYQVFQSNIVQKQIHGKSNATINQITNRDFRELAIPLPPLPEQRAIAAVLSDVDRYIAALERLIAKKRNIKQGAMQELLTGKRRLPGFSGEWVEKRIEEMGETSSGGTPSRSVSEYYTGNIPWVTTSELNDNYIFSTNENITAMAVNNSSAKQFPSGTVLMAMYGATIGKLGILAVDATTNQACCAFFFNKNTDAKFMYFVLFFNRAKIIELGSGAGQPNISQTIIKNQTYTVPQAKSEQTAIAAILSDMDAELDALTAKLAKIRDIKQGMMQELLTGRIRLISEEVELAPVVKPTAKVIKLPKSEQQPVTMQTGGHNQQFDDAVMIAGIVNALYSDKYPLGRKKVQKCLYLLRRHQDKSTAAFKKKAAGPYADEVRYKGGEPIARSAKYIVTTSTKGKGTTFARGGNITQALGYIKSWGRQADIKWLIDKLKFKKVDDLELLATVDMAICDLEEAGIPISVAAIKHLIATNTEWKAKLKKQSFSDDNIARAIKELQTLL